MSRAFTKEGDTSDDLPERPVSDRPNYVTANGIAALRRSLDELLRRRTELIQHRGKPEIENELKVVERDLRYVQSRIGSSILVDRSKDTPFEVRFGATVELQFESGSERWTIVGEDEADSAQAKLSWASPLALALMGSRVGDRVDLPQGGQVTVVSVTY